MKDEGKTAVNECRVSPCRAYRYSLLHDMRDPLFCQGAPKRIAWIGLNPSTADEETLDPTLRRVRDFTRRLGGDGFVMLNLFAFRATLPTVMKMAPDPVGPENDRALVEMTEGCLFVVCCWGNDGGFKGRSPAVRSMLGALGRDLRALKLTGSGEPSHPLYLPAFLEAAPLGLRDGPGGPCGPAGWNRQGEQFLAAYIEVLTKACQRTDRRYLLPGVREQCENMVDALAKGSSVNTSEWLKSAARMCGIKPTLPEIRAFVRGSGRGGHSL